MKMLQANFGTANYCHGAVAMWERDILGSEIMWKHDTVFNGEDMHMGTLLHAMRKNYKVYERRERYDRGFSLERRSMRYCCLYVLRGMRYVFLYSTTFILTHAVLFLALSGRRPDVLYAKIGISIDRCPGRCPRPHIRPGIVAGALPTARGIVGCDHSC